MARDLTVHKFGGASLADARAMRNAVAIVRGKDGSVAVVVSALAGVTDALLEAAAAVGKDSGRIEELAADLARRHARRSWGRPPVPSGRSCWRRSLGVRRAGALSGAGVCSGPV
jgi:aspartokinase